MSELTAGFTAARELDDQGAEVILNVLAALPPAGRYVTGACIGGDALIGRWLALNRPEARHIVIVPTDRSRVDMWWLKTAVRRNVLAEVILMPPGTAYADRNYQIVQRSTMLFGFPAYPEDDPRSARSGSWQTIRMARKAGKLSQWACVKPPYAGRIERYPSEFGRAQCDTSATARGDTGI
jgi:hypothetical protein